MVVMHPRGPRRRAQRGSDLLVLEPLLRPQQKHFALQPRQLLQPFAQPPLRLGGDRPLVRVAIGRSQVVAQRHYATALRAAVRVLQHVAPDREQPGTKAALPTERGDGAKRTDKCLLHHVIEIRLRGPRAREETRQRSRVTPDQFGRRLLVTALPGGDQRRVGRAGDGGNGLRGRHAWYGGRWSDGNIKGGGGRWRAGEGGERRSRLPPPPSTALDRPPPPVLVFEFERSF